jgi:TetR/AcrR family transcriptional regulator, transcriptional repressor of bet genes
VRDKLSLRTLIARQARAFGQDPVMSVSSPRVSTSSPPPAANGGGSRIRKRQRQRLIDACISALHIYGPSRTTVEKVVALADLSPGIVRFYFDSKAAMLVASLEYLAAEFEERVMAPVAALKDSPVQALRLLVDLYLDADIASPRKVSVWYAFWGEASARQEYQDICGKKDDDFAVLVHELVARLIAMTGAAHLDADGVALGLIGVLEVLWQGIAFQSEANIDRSVAVARSIAYLRSVFPGEFAPLTAPPRPLASRAISGGRLPAWVYNDAALLAAEREQLLWSAWQVLGHEAELRVAGDFLSADLAGERALVLRGERDKLHALRNTCRRRPHALVAARRGHLKSAIRCASHALTYTFGGRLVEGQTPGDLNALELARRGRLILVRAAGMPGAQPLAPVWERFATLVPRTVSDSEVAADWKVIVEQWLESPQSQQHFVSPNQLIDIGPAGAVILQVFPSVPGRSRIRRFDFAAEHAAQRSSWRRQFDAWLAAQVELAESTQSGLLGAAQEAGDTGPVTAALAQFRDVIASLVHALPAK